MFGYVRPSVRDLPEEELNRFRAMYCGLCHALSRRYGQAARFILNYDFTYLAILLSDGTAGAQGAGRCYTSPIKKRPFLEPTAAMELAADESVILAYWQLRDGVEDHAWASGLKYRAGARLLESAYKRAAALRPEFDQAVRRQLQLLSALEQAKDPSMDRAADSFAVLLSSAAEELTDPVRKRIMEQILYLVRSRGLGDVYKRQSCGISACGRRSCSPLFTEGCFRWGKPCWTAVSIAPAERISESLRKPNERSIRGPGSSPDRHR